MGEVDPRSEGVSEQLVDAVMGGVPAPVLLPNLDRLLRWLSSPGSPDALPIDALFRSRKVEPHWARRLALMLLDEALFSEPRLGPYRRLGLSRSATKAEARKRYHLLMRVYHPDRCDRASAWHSERAEQINEAYAGIQKQGSSGPDVRERGVTPSRDRRVRVRSEPRRRDLARALRRSLGRPHALRRRALAGVFIACTAFVVHTCVAQRSWRDWRAQTRTEPVAPQLPGSVAFSERAR